MLQSLPRGAALLGGGSLRTGLVSYWRFDDASGSSVADAVGGNTGTWQGTLGSQWGTGKINGDGVLNGTDNRVNVPNAAALNPTTALSFALWCKPTALPASNGFALLGKKTDGTGNQYALLIDGPDNANVLKYSWAIWTGAATKLLASTGAVPTIGVWHHLVGTYDGAIMVLYANGTAAGTRAQTGAVDTTTGALWLGCNFTTGTPGTFLTGALDEVALWSRALSATEVAALYNAGAGRAYPF